MAVLSTPVLSSALRDVVELKAGELNRWKEAFKNRYYNNEAINSARKDHVKRVTALLAEIKKHDPQMEDDDDVAIIERFLDQAKNDKSISQSKILNFEQKLLDKISMTLRRIELTSLHVDLLKEELISQDSASALTTRLEKAVLDDDFEVVEGGLEASFEKFEKNAFSKKTVDTEKLESYLKDMFQGEAGKEALDELRFEVDLYASSILDDDTCEVDDETVEWCIRDILANRPLGDETRKTLSGYLNSPVALRELKSTFKMKSVRHWNWCNADKGLPVTARQNDDGQYCIIVEEDIVDMLFLHVLATAWSVKLKGWLSNLVANTTLWVRNTLPSEKEMAKRDYYLAPIDNIHDPPPPPPIMEPIIISGPPPPPPSMPMPPPPPPPPFPPPPPGGWPRPPKKKKAKRFGIPYRSYGPNLNSERCDNYMRHFFLSRLPDEEGGTPQFTARHETQAEMIKHFAIEAKMREAFDGEAHGEYFNITSFASSMPHETILTVLKFIGVPQGWLDIFTRFLRVPLNMGPPIRGAGDQVLPRTTGVSIAHSMEILFGELILFFFDFAVHQKTGGYVYRIRDKCYFVGSCEQCEKFEQEAVAFVNAMEFTDFTLDTLATPSDPYPTWPLGLVAFGVQAGQKVSITIDDDNVEAFAHLVKKQLAACTTVIGWVRTWNHTVGTYAAHLFGPLTNVFGKPHLEAITKAYNRIHEIIFGSSNLTKHVTRLLLPFLQNNTLNDTKIAVEPLIFLPTAYGGLGVKNPYIALNLAHELPENANHELDDLLSREKAYYEEYKTRFEALDDDTRARRLAYKERSEITTGSEEASTFFSLSEFTKYREVMPYRPPGPALARHTFAPLSPEPQVISTYKVLQEEQSDDVVCSSRVLDYLRSNASARRGRKKWFSHESEDKWVLQMYSDECFDTYGGLEMWWSEGSPWEALKIVRDEDLEYDDDGSSVSDMTEV